MDGGGEWNRKGSQGCGIKRERKDYGMKERKG